MCDIDEAASAVLRQRFPGVPISGDIARLGKLPPVDILTAGFPCQDLSQAGPKVGISGKRSSLVDHVFRLVEASRAKPKWVVMENVSYMLKLDNGAAMQYLLRTIEQMGFSWAYRVLDARAFGLPQRRERVILIMSKHYDPSQALFPDGYVEPHVNDAVGDVDKRFDYGFYWTEGKRGLGWTRNAVPTIKGGSGIGIPSPPAIWRPTTNEFGTPTIRDAERLFGYPADWTVVAGAVTNKKGARWKLVGNTVCLPMVDWVCEQLSNPRGMGAECNEIERAARPPRAAFGKKGRRWAVDVSTWPIDSRPVALRKYLSEALSPLSLRAAMGFQSRARDTRTIRFAAGFLDGLSSYIETQYAARV